MLIPGIDKITKVATGRNENIYMGKRDSTGYGYVKRRLIANDLRTPCVPDMIDSHNSLFEGSLITEGFFNKLKGKIAEKSRLTHMGTAKKESSLQVL